MDRAQESREALLAGLAEVRRMILATAVSLASAQQEQVFLGSWSIKELLAHLSGWDIANIEAVQAVLDGRLPAFYDQHDRDWRRYNALLVERYGQEDFQRLLTAAADSHHLLLDTLRAVPAAEFDQDRGVRFRGYKVTIGRLLQAELEDERVHLQQIEAFKQQAQATAGPGAALNSAT
jgi:hypothetical protein